MTKGIEKGNLKLRKVANLHEKCLLCITNFINNKYFVVNEIIFIDLNKKIL